MKLRFIVSPQKDAPGSDVAGIAAALENVGFEGIAGAKSEQAIEFQIVGGDALEMRPALDQAIRDIAESFARFPRAGATIRCEAEPGPGSAERTDTPAVPVEPPPAPPHDLDSARAHEALPKVLAQPTPARRFLARRTSRATAPGASVDPRTGAAMLRIRSEGTNRSVAVANETPARYGRLDSRRSAQIAAIESLRTLVCAGASPLAVSVRFSLRSALPADGVMQLRDAVQGLAEALAFFDVPLAGATVEMAEEPAAAGTGSMLSVAAFGVFAADKHITRTAVSGAGQNLVLLGEAPHELGGSHFHEVVHGVLGGAAPAVDLAAEKRLGKAIRALIGGGVVIAARPLVAGGLLVAATEMLFAPERTFGAKLDVTPLGGGRADELLFGESQSRAIVVVAAERVGTVLSEAHMRGVPAVLIGEVTDDPAFGLKTRSLATEWLVAGLRQLWSGA